MITQHKGHPPTWPQVLTLPYPMRKSTHEWLTYWINKAVRIISYWILTINTLNVLLSSIRNFPVSYSLNFCDIWMVNNFQSTICYKKYLVPKLHQLNLFVSNFIFAIPYAYWVSHSLVQFSSTKYFFPLNELSYQDNELAWGMSWA